MITRIFEGQTVAIVGGGPSLKGMDFSRFRGASVIALNRAHEFIHDATVLWWADAEFFRMNRHLLEPHRAPWKATGNLGYEGNPLPDWVTQYKFTGRDGFDDDPGCLRHGNNSAYSAMNLAAHLGATGIVLFGVDMRYGAKGESHFHGGHGIMHTESTLREMMLPFFEHLRKPLARRGIEVLNASPHSALGVWQRCTIEQGLAALHENRLRRDPAA